MKLNVATRLIILSNLPEQGSLLDTMTKRQVRSLIDFNAEDVTFYVLKQDDKGNIAWNMEKDNEKPLEIEFSPEQVKYLSKIFKKLDEDGMLVEAIIDFVVELFELDKQNENA